MNKSNLDLPTKTSPRRSLLAWLAGLSIARKLGLGFGLLILLLLVGGVTSYYGIGALRQDTVRIVEVNNPLQQAVLEMEINTQETLQGALAYAFDADAEDREIFQDSKADFDRYAAQFESLAVTDEQRQLGETAVSQYSNIYNSAFQLVDLKDQQDAGLAALREQATALDGLLDDELQGLVDPAALDALLRQEASLEMEINVGEVRVGANAYLLAADPALLEKFETDIEDFRYFETQYRGLPLSSRESQLLDRISADFKTFEAQGRELIARADQISEVREKLEADATALDALLDNELQALILAELQANAAAAEATARNSSLTIIGASTLALVLGVFFSLLLSRNISGGIGKLVTGADALGRGELAHRIDITSRDELGTLAGAFHNMADRLRETLEGLEQRVKERTQNLELAAEVGREVSQVRALDVMLKEACELILKEFNLYYVQVYLPDQSRTNLVLEAGTGNVGAQLIGRGHRLSLDNRSINGRAAVEKRPVVIANTTQSATFRPNELLPDTRGEMAVPLIVADEVVGVLDMQSNQPDVLTEEALPAFEALAGQLAVAIQNASLLAEAEQARAEVEKQAARLSRANWREYLDALHKPEQIGFLFQNNQITSLLEQPELVSGGDVFAAPISVSGEKLGALAVEMEEQKRSAQSEQLIFAVARQVAQQIEALRLLESAERYRAEAEEASRRLIREGWKGYLDAKAGQGLSYLYDLKQVKPADGGNGNVHEAPSMNLPLKVRDETVGSLSVMGLDASDDQSIGLANAVIERLAAHIESLRLSEQVEKRAFELSTIATVSTTASSTLDPAQLLQSVVDLTKKNFGFYHAHIYLLNETGDTLELTAGAGEVGKQMVAEGRRIPLDSERSLVARAARTREGFFVNDVHIDPDFLPHPLLPKTASELAAPMIVGDKVVGVLDVQADTKSRFTIDDIRILTTLAAQVSVAIQNARSFEQAQRQAEREGKLNVISQKIQSATTVEAVLQIAARELGHALGAPMTIAQLSMKDKSS